MNVQFRAPAPAFTPSLPFAGKREPLPISSPVLSGPAFTGQRQAATGVSSFMVQWIKMSLRLIWEGHAEKQAEKRAAAKLAGRGGQAV